MEEESSEIEVGLSVARKSDSGRDEEHDQDELGRVGLGTEQECCSEDGDGSECLCRNPGRSVRAQLRRPTRQHLLLLPNNARNER